MTFKFEKKTLPPITRTQLVKYAGASGDYNPIHTDEEFAKNSPLKGIIAHGMLSMGFITQYVEESIGNPLLIKELTVQFRAVVRPGDVVTIEVVEESTEQDVTNLKLEVKNQENSIVLKGEVFIKNK